MIELRNVCKTFVLSGRRKVVADDISIVFPSNTAVAILGRNGAGKSTLLKMIAGSMDPDHGTIIRKGTLSWPVGFGGSFHAELTGLQNTRFIARVYGVDTDELCAFVADFAQLGDHFFLPVRTYSSGMRSRLAFGISMGIQFDTYLVDEISAVGDASFRQRSERLFHDRLTGSSAIVVTHSMPQVKRLCSRVALLENGKLDVYDDVDLAIEIHEERMKQASMAKGKP